MKMDRKFSKYTGCPICSWTWVGLTLIWVFHHVAPLPSHITIRPGRIGQAEEIQVNPTQSTSRWDTLYR